MRPAPKITPKYVVAIVEQARIEAAEEAAVRVPPPLAVAGLLAGLIGISWSSFSSAPGRRTLRRRPRRRPRSLPGLVARQGTDSESGGAETRAPDQPDTLRRCRHHLHRSPLGRHPFELSPATAPGLTVENDDPEKSVQALVYQNRKVAEGQLKSLKSEAERLRARPQRSKRTNLAPGVAGVGTRPERGGLLRRTSPDPRISTQFREVVSSTRSRWKTVTRKSPSPDGPPPGPEERTPAKASAVPETVKPFCTPMIGDLTPPAQWTARPAWPRVAGLRRSGPVGPTRSPGPRRRHGPGERRGGRTAWRGSPRTS